MLYHYIVTCSFWDFLVSGLHSPKVSLIKKLEWMFSLVCLLFYGISRLFNGISRLFNTKSSFMHINSSISNNSV